MLRIKYLYKYFITLILYKMKFKKLGKRSIVRQPTLLQNCRNITVGSYSIIESRSTLYSIAQYRTIEYEGKINIGQRCYINHSFNITCANSVTIEDDVTIAYNVSIFDNIHGTDPNIGNYNRQPLIIKCPVIIGQGSWIGANCFIMSSIGKGCIIGANSVVTKPIPDYCIAAGNPARVIKKYDFETKEWRKV